MATDDSKSMTIDDDDSADSGVIYKNGSHLAHYCFGRAIGR